MTEINTTTQQVSERVNLETTYIGKKKIKKWEFFIWDCTLKTNRGSVSIEYTTEADNKGKPIPPTVNEALNSLFDGIWFFELYCKNIQKLYNMSFDQWHNSINDTRKKTLNCILLNDSKKNEEKVNTLFNQQEIEVLREELCNY